MKKRGFLLTFMLICAMSIVALAENNSIIDNIIIDMNTSETPTSSLDNIQVEGDNDGTPIESQPTEDDDIFSDIGGIEVWSIGAGAQLMSNTESDDYTVTLTFDLTNTSSMAVNFHIYVAVYEQTGNIYSVSKQEKTLLSTQKQQILFKLTLENDGVDKTGKIFVWGENMLPTTSNGSFEIKNGNPDKLPNLTMDESMIANSDRYYNNVTINSGTLDLNGHKFYINGDLIQSGGTVYVNNGELIVNGDYRIQTRSETTDQYGDVSISYVGSSGILNMTNENDRVLVNGDFYMQSSYYHSGYLQNGVMELKGDFTQYGLNNFDASKNHKVVFSGEDEQNIYFTDRGYSGFADAEFKNTKINIKSNLRGWVLKRDTVIDNDVNYSIVPCISM